MLRPKPKAQALKTKIIRSNVKKILLIFAHPAFQKSRVNARLIEALAEMDGITFHDLYQAYPEFDIDVAAEQQLLIEHDVIVFHHPFFWYSTPALLKEWQDLVLEHGWAYGSQGNHLKDKWFFNIITTGGSEAAYSQQGYNFYTIRQLLAPIEQTARLCKMVFLPPYVVHGTHAITPEEIEAYRENGQQLLAMIRDENFDLAAAGKLQYLNDYLKRSDG